MKKLILKGGVVAVITICTQGYWVSKAFDTKATEFDHSVSVALYSVADTMSEQATVQKRSANYFYVETNSPLSNHEVDALVRKELSARNIDLDYEIGVYNAEDDTLVYANRVDSGSSFTSRSGCDGPDEFNKNFAVLFPSKASFLMGSVDLWVLLVSLLAVLCWIYFASYLEQPTSSALFAKSHQIRLGHSRLDFHNRDLVVNHQTYHLTHKENEILRLLFEHPNEIIDREVFLQQIWGKDGFFVARSMDVFISKVRKYLNDDQTLKIENLRTIGYRLRVKK